MRAMRSRKKQILLAGAALVVIGIVWAAGSGWGAPRGDTRQSREQILEASLAKGTDWRIVTESQVAGYIVSGGVSSDGMATIAVFAPEGAGKYRFYTATNRSRNHPMLAGATIDGSRYDLCWFSDVPTEYALLTYTANGETKTLQFDTGDGDIVANPAPQGDYTLQARYVDGDGILVRINH